MTVGVCKHLDGGGQHAQRDPAASIWLQRLERRQRSAFCYVKHWVCRLGNNVPERRHDEQKRYGTLHAHTAVTNLSGTYFEDVQQYRAQPSPSSVCTRLAHDGLHMA